jgi:peptide/nickel transport system ATP-binding protein
VPQIGRTDRLTPIDGTVPSMLKLPRGCAFAPRCQHAMDICRRSEPPVFALGDGHASKCWLHDDNAVAGHTVPHLSAGVDRTGPASTVTASDQPASPIV